MAATRWRRGLFHQSELVASAMRGREAADPFRLLLNGLDRLWKWSGLNRQPSACHADALPDLSYTPLFAWPIRGHGSFQSSGTGPMSRSTPKLESIARRGGLRYRHWVSLPSR